MFSIDLFYQILNKYRIKCHRIDYLIFADSSRYLYHKRTSIYEERERRQRTGQNGKTNDTDQHFPD
jgi:hypothetical protein